ncbi:ferric reductase transmembrane component [Trematosphaeria pertusa]|uniref:Ferric reductase transmembrane component n=1 Tax=Trematosphaeria pertusa TaxID=390896 RepID=A0A6A6I1T8_9PLEO|nr:ferric reductase transmembrane component [Trematosphaeria pertusa]KAF2244246.1 ferric reductase transmembrane component [Trematosphaeria pertusa]
MYLASLLPPYPPPLMDSITLSWVQDALRISRTAISSTSSLWLPSSESVAATGGGELVNPDDPGKDPRFRKLVEAILFGRKFVPTYNLVLLAVLLVFTAWHWAEKLALRQRKRRIDGSDGKADDRVDEAWSSSSSTIEGTATPPDASQKKTDAADETSPLLAAKPTKRKALGIRKPYYLLKSWMQYQPRSIPIINRALPTNAVSLFVIAYIALNVFYNFYAMPLSLQYVFVFADRCGLIFSANLPILYLLAAKNQPIKFLTGYSYESLNIFHRRVGELMCFEALVHFLGMLFVWYGLLRRLGFTLAQFILNRLVLLGLGAFISYQVLYFTSLGSFRQRMYEVFLATHILLQIAGLVFLWLHYETSRPYVGVSLAIFLIDRLVFRLWLNTTSHPATLTVLEDDETLLLSANWNVSDLKSVFIPKNMRNGWKPNDHIFITVPSISHKYMVQAHPFTIFSAAPTLTQDEEGRHAWFSLLIRAQADSGFTRTLLEHSRSHPQTRIRLDGPYGTSHALDVISSSDTAILVAGGSGIAVAYPLLYALLQPTSTDPENQSSPKNKRKVKLLWIVHSPSHRDWVPHEKMKELEEWGLELYIPAPTSVVGRPDVRPILREWVEGERTGIVVSGPDGLVRDVRNTCAGLIGEGVGVKVQVEKFGW